jgi:hypothetical protein
VSRRSGRRKVFAGKICGKCRLCRPNRLVAGGHGLRPMPRNPAWAALRPGPGLCRLAGASAACGRLWGLGNGLAPAALFRRRRCPSAPASPIRPSCGRL